MKSDLSEAASDPRRDARLSEATRVAEFEQQMMLAREIMKRRWDALRKLAK